MVNGNGWTQHVKQSKQATKMEKAKKWLLKKACKPHRQNSQKLTRDQAQE